MHPAESPFIARSNPFHGAALPFVESLESEEERNLMRHKISLAYWLLSVPVGAADHSLHGRPNDGTREFAVILLQMEVNTLQALSDLALALFSLYRVQDAPMRIDILKSILKVVPEERSKLVKRTLRLLPVDLQCKQEPLGARECAMVIGALALVRPDCSKSVVQSIKKVLQLKKKENPSMTPMQRAQTIHNLCMSTESRVTLNKVKVLTIM